VLGDQLDRRSGALGRADPATDRILLVESTGAIAARPWHRQRAHLVITAMRRFGAELAAEGFEVDQRRSTSLVAGWREHVAEHAPSSVVVTEPSSWRARERLRGLDIELVRDEQFLCHPDDFAAWAAGRRRLTMEDFYRWQRRRLDILMDGDEPVDGRWNFDAENREAPPRDGRAWPEPPRDELDDVDRAVLADLPPNCWGAEPDGTWATSRAGALVRLRHAIDHVLPRFGPHEDAMLTTSWHLAHTLLSPYLNLGLLHPREVCAEIEAAYRSGAVPIASAEGLIRQIIGWREYVWGTYWWWMPGYRDLNELDAHRPLPPALHGTPTRMRCVEHAVRAVHDHGWAHHIQRLMVLGNLCLLAGVEPLDLVDWMRESFVDGADWVMLPNVIGMALFADGGRMSTKPYASGGAYLKKMGDACRGCRFDPGARTGERACPYTTLYWDFLARNEPLLAGNHRMARPLAAMRGLRDLPAVRERAVEVLRRLDAGTL
jgi:deoxyribodipyrimidine photolyase-related protein